MKILIASLSDVLAPAFMVAAGQMASQPSLQIEPLYLEGADQTFDECHVQADYILFPSLFTDDAMDVVEAHLLHCMAMASASGIPLIFLSCADVFESGRGVAYSEAEMANAQGEYAQSVWALEQLVRNYAKHIILRTGNLVGGPDDDICLALKDAACEGKPLDFCQRVGFAPTHYEDLARVLLAMCLQLPNQIESRFGTFHYTSSEVTTELEFVKVVLSVLAQRDKRYEGLEFAAMPSGFDSNVAVLKCDKLLHTFGVKQRPWRSYLAQLSETYLAVNQ